MHTSITHSLPRILFWSLIGIIVFFVSGCTFRNSAKDWNALDGQQGRPVYYTSVERVGVNLFVGIPLGSRIQIDGMVDALTADIKESGGNNVRIVQGSSENYWYGFPPFTWILTPVITTISAEYEPDSDRYVEDQRTIAEEKTEEER